MCNLPLGKLFASSAVSKLSKIVWFSSFWVNSFMDDLLGVEERCFLNKRLFGKKNTESLENFEGSTIFEIMKILIFFLN